MTSSLTPICRIAVVWLRLCYFYKRLGYYLESIESEWEDYIAYGRLWLNIRTVPDVNLDSFGLEQTVDSLWVFNRNIVGFVRLQKHLRHVGELLFRRFDGTFVEVNGISGASHKTLRIFRLTKGVYNNVLRQRDGAL